MPQLARFLGLTLVVAAGCGDDGAGPDAPRADAAPRVDAAYDAGARIFRGTSLIVHHTPSGLVSTPGDLTGSSVEAYVRDAPAVRYPGEVGANGTFSIPGVPWGDLVVRISGEVPTYYVTGSTTLELVADQLGRADAVPAPAGTSIDLSLTGLAPWVDGAQLELYSATAGTAVYDLGTPALGATTLALAVDLEAAGASLLDAALDTVLITQLEPHTVDGRTYLALGRAFVPDPFTTPAGAAVAVSGALAAAPASAPLQLVWDRGAYDAALRAQVAGEPDVDVSLVVHAIVDGATHGWYDDSADLVLYFPALGPHADTLTATWPYNDPFPSTWARLVSTSFRAYRTLEVPGGSQLRVSARMVDTRPLAEVTSSSPIAPVLGPVASFAIAGRDAFGALDGIGVAPTVTWAPPALGAADSYAVEVRRVETLGTHAVASTIARFVTPDTSITVPSEVLVPGEAYVFVIAARGATARAELTSSLATP